MLALFRKKRRGLKWILWVVILALGAGMVLLFVDSPGGVQGTIGAQNVASVDGRTITALTFRRSYQRLYEAYREAYKLDEQDPDLVRRLGLGQRARDQLIAQYAILAEAERMGIEATEEEVRERIARLPSFQENGRFKLARYQDVLRINNFTPEEFEGDIRRTIAGEKLLNVLADGIVVLPEAVKQEFLDRNQEVKVRYVAFDPAKRRQASVEEKKLRKYFDDNKESYRLGEQRKLQYVTVTPDANTIEVSEEQIESLVETLSGKEQVRASHILIRVGEGDEAQAKKRAEEILRQIRSGSDFAQMAKRYSEDETTAEKGGDLGFFERGQLVPEFESVAFSLRPGKVSDLVQTPFGFHIIKKTEAARSDPRGRRTLAEFEARQQEADKEASSLANRIAYELKKGSSLKEVATQHGLAIKETSYFGLADPVAGLLVRKDFNRKVFTLKKGEVMAPHHSSGGYIVATLTDVNPPELPTFEKLRDRLEEDFKVGRGDEQARERAYAFYKAAKGSDFEREARTQDLRVTTTGFFKKGTTIDDTLKFSPELHKRAFRMDVGDTSPPIKIAGKYAVFTVLEKSSVDWQKFEREKRQMTEELTTRDRRRFFF